MRRARAGFPLAHVPAHCAGPPGQTGCCVHALSAPYTTLTSLPNTQFASLTTRPSPLRPSAPLPRPSPPARTLFIGVESTPNPDALKFLPQDTVVLPESFGQGMHFSDAASAAGSKLVRRLLKTPSVTGVFLGRDFISVNKTEGVQWAQLRPILLNAMMDEFAEAAARGGSIIEAGGDASSAPVSADTAPSPDDTEVVSLIKELLETRIRPAVQEDGGDIFFRGFDADTGLVSLQMAGSCVGCPSSTATLHSGVENMLKHYVPEVTGITQVKSEVRVFGVREKGRQNYLSCLPGRCISPPPPTPFSPQLATQGEAEVASLEAKLAAAGAT